MTMQMSPKVLSLNDLFVTSIVLYFDVIKCKLYVYIGVSHLQFIKPIPINTTIYKHTNKQWNQQLQ